MAWPPIDRWNHRSGCRGGMLSPWSRFAALQTRDGLGQPLAHAYSTAVGQRDSVILADGSRVMLGPDSRLTVPADYGVTTRTVALRGDGYFDVHHDSATPFVVHAGDAVIEDIGTRFTIESDALDTTTVSVLAGSVRLRAVDSATTTGAILARRRSRLGDDGGSGARCAPYRGCRRCGVDDRPPGVPRRVPRSRDRRAATLVRREHPDRGFRRWPIGTSRTRSTENRSTRCYGRSRSRSTRGWNVRATQ